MNLIKLIMKIPVEKIVSHVICYSQKTYDEVVYPSIPLDHRENQRSDWQEYWPIRNFLIWSDLDDDTYYGFLSPRFSEKTGLSSEFLHQYISGVTVDHDVITFSPQPDMAAFFINVFEQNEVFDPGFMKCAQKFFDHANIDVDLSSMIMDSTHIVFSNYFFAKPAFWRKWLSICEMIFDLCENKKNLAEEFGLTKPTTYRDGVQRKVFLIERIASLLLKTDSHFKVHPYNTFLCAYSASRLKEFSDDAVISDALKIAYNKSNYPEYFQQFSKIRDKIRNAKL